MDYILWLIVFIFFISIVILVLYLYQTNARNIPVNPVITNFGVTISNQDGSRLSTLESLVVNTGTNTAPVFVNQNFMVMANEEIARGDTTTGWVIHSLDNTKTGKVTVSIQNNYTGNFMTWNPTESGNIEVFESNSRNQPPDPSTPNSVGWFKLTLLPTVIGANGVPDKIVQFESLNPTGRFLTVGPSVGSNDPGRNIMVLAQPGNGTNNIFRVSTSQGKSSTSSPIV